MAAPTLRYRWTQESFLRAEAAGAFEGRVELVEGEVWPVSIGRWHGTTTMRVGSLLRGGAVEVTQESLVTAGSLPDPDVWVRPAEAVESRWLSPRISVWGPADVLLVVEVSDETVAEDLSVKARLYGAAGYAVYWVLTHDTLHEHTSPDAQGYRTVRRYERGDEVALPWTTATLAVADLLGDATV